VLFIRSKLAGAASLLYMRCIQDISLYTALLRAVLPNLVFQLGWFYQPHGRNRLDKRYFARILSMEY